MMYHASDIVYNEHAQSCMHILMDAVQLILAQLMV